MRIVISGFRAILFPLVFMTGISAFAAPAQLSQHHGYVPGRFIVKVKPEARVSQMMQSAASMGSLRPLIPSPARAGAEQFSRYWVFVSSQQTLTAADVASALGTGNLDEVEQDQYLEFYDFPTDPLFVDQWYLHNTGQQYLGIDRSNGAGNDRLVEKSGTPGVDIHISRFYQSPPSETTKVVVAIIDTGEDLKHPELQGRFWHNPDEIPNNGVDDDHNGYVDDTLGYDLSGDTSTFLDIVGDDDPTDAVGHGTHIGGIIAANADGQGVVGEAPWAQIMAVKIYPNAYLSIGTEGILYAVNSGARIINISWGSPFESVAMKEALSFARANGVLVTIAAGNTGDNTRSFPAAFDSTFAVAAGDSKGNLAWFSTFGPFVSLVAPGVDILSLRAAGTDMYAAAGEPGLRIIGPDSLYYLSDGTSMAAPTVAGAAALIWSFRPDLSLSQLEDVLRMGAIDMVDPRQTGDTLVGYDTISGFGYLCVECSLDLLTNGGVALLSPVLRARYGGDLPITGIAVAGYTGTWQLDYSVGEGGTSWLPLAQGTGVPADSVLAHFNHPEINNIVNLRLTDQFNSSKITSFRYVNSNQLRLETPHQGDTLRFSIPISASAFGPTFDSAAVFYRSPLGKVVQIFVSSQEYFNTHMFDWNVSGISTGNYDLIVRGYFGPTVISDSVRFFLASTFARGWPQQLPGRGGQTVVAADLNHDGVKELIFGTFYGMFVYEPDGRLLPNFPVLTNMDMRCLPAIYDVDHDGQDEIVCTSTDGLHALKFDGTEAPGFPVPCATGRLVFGSPTPTIAALRHGDATLTDTMAIVFVDAMGKLHAYKLNGQSYFYSTGGLYSEFYPYDDPAYFFAANEVAVADVLGTGRPQVIATYAGLVSRSGVALYDGRNGQPALAASTPQVLAGSLVNGTAVGDLSGDGLPELVTTGQDSVYNRVVWVLTRTPDGKGLMNYPGWPKIFPEVSGWIGNIPTIADLDLDGVPEILFSFYDLDAGSLYAFHADGTPYRNFPGRPDGELFHYSACLGVPMVADLTGDRYPEIVLRGGYILPGTGTEKIFVLDHNGDLLPGYPAPTPAKPNEVVSNPFAPLIDDVDGDGLVDLVYSGDANQIYMWNFDASYRGGKNKARLGSDDRNTHVYVSPGIPTDVNEPHPELPAAFALSQNFPNPFNPSTRIGFDLPARAQVRLDLYNVLGQLVRTLVDGVLSAGHHEVDFNGAGLASGVYLYRLTAGNQTEVKKMVLLK